MKPIKTVAIHPAIGVARLDLPDAIFVETERGRIDN